MTTLNTFQKQFLEYGGGAGGTGEVGPTGPAGPSGPSGPTGPTPDIPPIPSNTDFTDPVAIGTDAGINGQAFGSIAIGLNAGSDNCEGLSIGTFAGSTDQALHAVAIGTGAGQISQGLVAVAVGNVAGQTSQLSGAVAVGNEAGTANQSESAVAVGDQAGKTTQGERAIAIGKYAGEDTQGSQGIAIGTESGRFGQSANAIAIGTEAGYNAQGQYAIAIGFQASGTSQPANSIVLNAGGTALDAPSTGFFVDPLQEFAGPKGLYYDSTTKEITYADVGIGPQGFQGIEGGEGPQGFAGTNGSSSSFFPYRANTADIYPSDPGTGKFVWNNPGQTGATFLKFSAFDSDGFDVEVLLNLVETGGTILIQDAGDSTTFQKFITTGPPVGVENEHVSYPVVIDTFSGDLIGNNDSCLLIISNVIAGPQGAVGFQGVQGLQGFQGMEGLQGAQGFQGVQGLQGFQGMEGVQGAQGFQGIEGLGFQGFQGLDAFGLQGLQGIPGPDGVTGGIVVSSITSPTDVNFFDGGQRLLRQIPLGSLNLQFDGDYIDIVDTGFYGISSGASNTEANMSIKYYFRLFENPPFTETYLMMTPYSNISGFPLDTTNFISPYRATIRLTRVDSTTLNVSGTFQVGQNAINPTVTESFQNISPVSYVDTGLTAVSYADINNCSMQLLTSEDNSTVDGNHSCTSQNVSLTKMSSVLLGPTGPVGVQGATGPEGGPTGPQGPVGVAGSAGAQGAQGFQGMEGLQGAQGFQGIEGLGTQGFQGLVGPTGDGGGGGGSTMVYNGAAFTDWSGFSATFYTIPISGVTGDFFETNVNAYIEAGNTIEFSVGGRTLILGGGSFGLHVQLRYTTRILSLTTANTVFVGCSAVNDGDGINVQNGNTALMGFDTGLTAGVGSFTISGIWFDTITSPTALYGCTTVKTPAS